ncbi:nucleoside-diphosphate sugar epimerase, partial [Plesiomonas shigelloides]
LPALPSANEVYLALGTTIKDAGSKDAFRAVDFDANLDVAIAARKVGLDRIGIVGAMGANPNSVVFYSRVKGELELAVENLSFGDVT